MWTKLQVYSDWGYKYLAPEGKGLTDRGYSDVGRGLRFIQGQLVKIRWPDGYEETVDVDLHTHTEMVSDMGREYPVDSKMAGFWASIHCKRVWFCLDAVEVDLELGDSYGHTQVERDQS